MSITYVNIEGLANRKQPLWVEQHLREWACWCILNTPLVYRPGRRSIDQFPAQVKDKIREIIDIIHSGRDLASVSGTVFNADQASLMEKSLGEALIASLTSSNPVVGAFEVAHQCIGLACFDERADIAAEEKAIGRIHRLHLENLVQRLLGTTALE